MATATVFTNAVVHSMVPGVSPHRSLAHAGGRIVAVGSERDVIAASGAQATLEDLGGRTVVPGFIDPHHHFLTAVIEGNALDASVGAASSIAALKELLRAHHRRRPEGAWLLAVGYDELALQDRRHPVRGDQDDACPGLLSSRARLGLAHGVSSSPFVSAIRHSRGNGNPRSTSAFAQIWISASAEMTEECAYKHHIQKNSIALRSSPCDLGPPQARPAEPQLRPAPVRPRPTGPRDLARRFFGRRLRRQFKTKSSIWDAEAPAWREARRARTGLYITDERQIQAGWIGVPGVEYVLISLLSVRRKTSRRCRTLRRPAREARRGAYFMICNEKQRSEPGCIGVLGDLVGLRRTLSQLEAVSRGRTAF